MVGGRKGRDLQDADASEVGRGGSGDEAVGYALSEEPERPPVRSAGLTRREREVTFLVGWWLNNRRIASELSLSEHTVHHHVTNILEKLNLSSREQVASRLPDRQNPVG